ncbi:PEGA domain-containing protein [Candidatus Saccharibacteria bacterium]|nr:PEGA domain-containing protein [Candidatus Saccharibacteria bacterium]
MDQDLQKRRQQLKVIISEVIMTLAVIITVVILGLIVSGYWLNSDFEIERQGMIQISSVPTGATLEIDGASSWFQKTNTSKILTSGEHEVVLTKEGYDTWKKNVTISEGLLYRVSYPQLFLKEREKETMLNLSGSLAAYVSPNSEMMLVTNDTTEWTLINLDRTELEPKKINIAPVLDSSAMDTSTRLFSGKILSATWNRDNSKILFHIQNGEALEWVLLDTKNIAGSINLTQQFGINFDHVDILDNSANSLLTISDYKIQKIDVGSKSISAVIADKVDYYSFSRNEIIISAQNAAGEPYIGLIKLSDNKIQVLEDLHAPAKAFISKFYDDNFIIALESDRLAIYRKDDLSSVTDLELPFVPEKISIGQDGSFILLNTDDKIATLDMETMLITEWTADSKDYKWLNGHMIYTTLDGELKVYDYDGLNKRQLAKNVSSRFPVVITSDKWLYYFSDDQLMREWLVAR